MRTTLGRVGVERADVSRFGGWLAIGSAAMLTLSGCDGGSATSSARTHAALGAPGASTASAGWPSAGQRPSDGYARGGGSDGGYDQPDHRRDPEPLYKGKPLWAANKRHSAQDNAEYHFERDGPDFGAKSVDDYVAKVHAFVDSPPASVQTISRSNGDRLLYDREHNVFAVVAKDGAPRTMFKPRDGAAYWDEQAQREADRAKSGGDGGRRYGRRSSSSGDDTGGEG